MANHSCIPLFIQMRKKQPNNNVLRSENDRIRRENIAIQEVLKKMICPSCGSPPLAEEESMQSLEKLRQENLELRQEVILHFAIMFFL